MASADQLTDMVALLLFQNIREGMQNGRIADLGAAKTEVDSAIAELNRRRLSDERASFNVELVGQLLLEVGSMREKVAKCEAQLADFENQARLIREDTAQIAARTDACNLIVERQQRENATVLAVVEGAKVGAVTSQRPRCFVPTPSPINPELRAAPSRMALVSFPGGPRTVTIHPPHSPNHQSIVCDEGGDVILDFRRAQPLRREGAFRGSLEDIDWDKITQVRGRASESNRARPVVPPAPCWSDRSQPPARGPPPSPTADGIVAKQRRSSNSGKACSLKQILAPEDPVDGTSTSNRSSVTFSRASQDSQSSSSSKQEVFTTPLSTPPSPSVGRGKKRTRVDEDNGDMSLIADIRNDGSGSNQLRAAKEPMTPTHIKREEVPPPEGPAKRKKLRSSTSSETL